MRLACVCIVFALSAPVAAQWINHPTPGVPKGRDGKPNLAAPAPRTAGGTPELSGVWQTRIVPGVDPSTEPVAGSSIFPAEFTNIAARLNDGPPYQAWARALWQSRQDNLRADSPAGRCDPAGILQRLTNILPKRFMQAPGLLVILFEEHNEFRQIFTDGRAAPVDPLPAFNGYSTGKWVGDTLIVTTTGFKDDWWADRRGTPLTSAATVTEKYRRINYGNMDLEITIDDSKAYTRPWTITLPQEIALNTDLMEYFCTENEKDRAHIR